MNTKKIVAVIPARYQSSRFPGKPLAYICGKPMIQRVYERVCSVDEIKDVYVATDDERIFKTVQNFGGKAIMTGECTCGTERVYAAVQNVDCDIVLNIQGDEPLVQAAMIRELISAFEDPSVLMATLKKQIYDEKSINDTNIVKMVTNEQEDAIYFSRSKIPFNRESNHAVKYFKHIGIYGYIKKFLAQFVSMPQTQLEVAEQLEQLRVIEHGYRIRVVETKFDSIGVDLPEHIALIEKKLSNEEGGG